MWHAALYIGAGSRLSSAMARPQTRKWLDRAVGAIFIAIALGILAGMLLGA
jgi:homoserine/homoserine lactone efflux protein